MGLQDIVLATASVKVSDGVQFAVRGLSPYDVATLYSRYQDEMANLFRRVMDKANTDQTVDVETDVIMKAPELVAAAITLASSIDPADNETFLKAMSTARQLPVGAQVDALEKIGGLTFTSDMPPGKFVRLIVEIMQGMTIAIRAQTNTNPLT